MNNLKINKTKIKKIIKNINFNKIYLKKKEGGKSQGDTSERVN